MRIVGDMMVERVDCDQPYVMDELPEYDTGLDKPAMPSSKIECVLDLAIDVYAHVEEFGEKHSNTMSKIGFEILASNHHINTIEQMEVDVGPRVPA
ncbi:hypothetical protein L7F22_029557 [Adiantum nelumboides]|nr:hypothetical protein [Adiantum nelumboides]